MPMLRRRQCNLKPAIKKEYMLKFIRRSFLAFTFFLSPHMGYSQAEKGTVHAGISALPIADLLQLFPKNDISGYGIIPELGFFPLKKLDISFGLYNIDVKNSYNVHTNHFGDFRKEERLKLLIANLSIRYYFLKGKFRFYPVLAMGTGNLDIFSYRKSDYFKLGYDTGPVLAWTAGAGMNYFLNERIAFELNIPYTSVDSYPDVKNRRTSFQTVAPSLGVKLFFNTIRKKEKLPGSL
jgi:hypothetical protein